MFDRSPHPRWLRPLIRRMKRRGVAHPRELTGVSEAELAEFERARGTQLPVRYREFLLACGMTAGHLGRSVDFLWPRARGLHADFAELVAEDAALADRLPADAVLINSYSTWFDYVRCDGADDPPVVRMCIERADDAGVVRDTFSAYLRLMIDTADTAPPAPTSFHVDAKGNIVPGIVDANGDVIDEG